MNPAEFLPFDDKQCVRQIDGGETRVLVSDEIQLPPELQGSAPREIPDWIYAVKSIRRPWILSWIAVLIFVSAIALGASPLGDPWSRIAFWVTAIMGGLGALGLMTVRKDLRYVRDGCVASGRVTALTLQPAQSHQGQALSYQHVVELELKLSSGEVLHLRRQGLSIGADDRDSTTARFRCDDHVPVVWLPGRFSKTLTLYDFLSFNAQRALIKKEKTGSLWVGKLKTALAVVLIFTVLIGNLFLFMRCVPVGFSVLSVTAVGVAGAFLLGGGILYLITLELRKDQQKSIERNRKAELAGEAIEVGWSHVMMSNTLIGWGYYLTVAAGSLLMGGLTVVMWAFGLNIWLDQSAFRNEVIVVTKVIEQKNGADVDVQFQLVNEPDQDYSQSFARRDLPAVPLVVGGEVLVEWHRGRFGWPWIRNFRFVQRGVPL